MERIRITPGTFPTQQGPFDPQRSFVQRLIETTFTLSPDQKTGQPIKFAGTNSDSVTLSGFRTMVRIQQSGAPAASYASVQIFGMDKTMMNQLTTLGIVFNSIQRNTILISAGDTEGGLSPVFGGTVHIAFAGYSGQPNVPFCCECQSGYINQVIPVAASSFPQSTDVATIMSGFARQLGKGFENNGVTVKLPPSYFSGDLMTQVRRTARAANIRAELVNGDTVLAIWPMGGSRDDQGDVPLISKATGMIKSPNAAPNGYLIVSMLFNPKIAFGATVRIESDLVPQVNNRQWVVQRLDLELDAYVPKGQWKAKAYCFPKGYAVPPPPEGSFPG